MRRGEEHYREKHIKWLELEGESDIWRGRAQVKVRGMTKSWLHHNPIPRPTNRVFWGGRDTFSFAFTFFTVEIWLPRHGYIPSNQGFFLFPQAAGSMPDLQLPAE